MREKLRARNIDKSRYQKKQRAKKADKKLRKDRAQSRNVRKYIRKQIIPYYHEFRNHLNKNVLIVLKDTDNMDRILFKVNNIGNGMTLLTLPCVSEDEIINYLDSAKENDSTEANKLISDKYEAMRGFIRHTFSVNAETVMDKGRLLILRNCKVVGQKEGYVALNVRPYDAATWYKGDSTTVHAYRVYKGKNLKIFFNIEGNISKTLVYYDTIATILLYRSYIGKINFNEFLGDHYELSKRQFLGTFHDITVYWRKEQTAKRFRNEKYENRILNEKD
ncbi:MAG: hypothetical protein IKR04_02770 [Clostridia bacterium]|nr:hypothetical protein [Clostridia bacterium]